MGSSLQKPGAAETPAADPMRYIPHGDVNHALPGNWQGFGGMRQMLPSQPGGPQLFTDPAHTVQAGQASQGNQMAQFQQILQQLGLPMQALGGGPAPAQSPNTPLGMPNLPMPAPAAPAPAAPKQFTLEDFYRNLPNDPVNMINA